MVAWVLIALYTVIPWIKFKGLPLVLLDLVERKFVFLGTVFRPTETLLFGVLSLLVFVVAFLLTALLGRVWCGWGCPQTVYLEFVFRPLERVFLGRGYSSPHASVPGWRRVALSAAQVVVCAHLANTLLAWFVGADNLTRWIFTSAPSAHPVAFAVFASVTLLMLFDFLYFREQLCSLACPYGRLQSALLDRDSLIVGYDKKRGEPRGKGARKSAGAHACGGKCNGQGGCGSGSKCDHDHDHDQDHDHDHAAERLAASTPARGDCVDCTLCVQTCPAGIDIRDGLQLECIQCTQCIDACDAVMRKLSRPTGLIRYSSERALQGTPRTGVRMRLVVYPLLLGVLVIAAGYLLMTRTDGAVALLRTQGAPYIVKQLEPRGETIESVVRLRIDNRTRGALTYTVAAGEGVELLRAESVEVQGDASREVDVVVRSGPNDFLRGRREIELSITEQGARKGAYRATVKTAVLGPLVIPPLRSGGAL